MDFLLLLFFLHYTRTCPQIKDLSQRKQQVTENLGCKLLAKPITFFFPSKKTQVRVECERNSFGLARKSEQTAWAAPSICTSSSQRSSTNVGFCLYPDDVTYNNIFIFIYLGFLEIKRQYSIIFFCNNKRTYIHTPNSTCTNMVEIIYAHIKCRNLYYYNKYVIFQTKRICFSNYISLVSSPSAYCFCIKN